LCKNSLLCGVVHTNNDYSLGALSRFRIRAPRLHLCLRPSSCRLWYFSCYVRLSELKG
jgi:hypothetical protein